MIGSEMSMVDLARAYDNLATYAFADETDPELSRWLGVFRATEGRFLREPAIDGSHVMSKLMAWKNVVARSDVIDPGIHLQLFDQLMNEVRALTGWRMMEGGVIKLQAPTG